MAHPKRKISKTRRDKRRTHDKLTPRAVVTCATTGEIHLYHHAYVHEGNLYRHGKMVIENYTSVA